LIKNIFPDSSAYAQIVNLQRSKRNPELIETGRSAGGSAPRQGRSEIRSAAQAEFADHAGLADLDAFPSREIP
jgi:hypothetical protein